MSNTASLANDYAALDAQIKELTKKRDAIKAEIIATGEKSVVGDLAEVTVSESYPTTFSKDLAQTLLSDVDFKRCFATAIKPTIKVSNITSSLARPASAGLTAKKLNSMNAVALVVPRIV